MLSIAAILDPKAAFATGRCPEAPFIAWQT